MQGARVRPVGGFVSQGATTGGAPACASTSAPWSPALLCRACSQISDRVLRTVFVRAAVCPTV
eukprot:4327850-Lingulodinium_polyedra.AAC.1